MTEARTEIAGAAESDAPQALRATPAVDIFENADEVLILADLPGVSRDAVNIRVDERELTIEATRTIAGGEPIQYRRAFGVPRYLDAGATSAELLEGVLHLRLPKRDAAKPRKVEIKTA
jgi:HSP20 family molecular chaperone IbpA